MRFIIYITLLAAVLPLVLTRPFFGLCVYYVVSLLEPKILCWHPDLQDAFLVGLPLIIGAIAIGVTRSKPSPVTNDANQIVDIRWVKQRSPLFEIAWPVWVLLALVAYIAIVRLFVPYPLANSTTHFRNLCKVVLVSILLTGMASDVRRFRILYLVVGLSVAFWAIKGGLKLIILGPHQLYGKTYDNNLFALTSVMVLPMIFYFGQSLRHIWWRWVFIIASGLICLAIISTHSRAGFLALVVVLGCMAWSSRFRVRAMLAVFLLGSAAMITSGPEIRERITSILHYEEDASSRARFFTWDVARDLFLEHPIVGIGLANYELAKRERIGDRKSAHNIYLQNAAELGLVGHSLWLLMLFGTMISLYRFMRRCRRLPGELKWAYLWSRGLLLGLLGFSIHGMFHNEDFLELMLTMVGMNVALQAALGRELQIRKLTHLITTPGPQVADAPPSSVRSIHPARLFPQRKPLGV